MLRYCLIVYWALVVETAAAASKANTAAARKILFITSPLDSVWSRDNYNPIWGVICECYEVWSIMIRQPSLNLRNVRVNFPCGLSLSRSRAQLPRTTAASFAITWTSMSENERTPIFARESYPFL